MEKGGQTSNWFLRVLQSKCRAVVEMSGEEVERAEDNESEVEESDFEAEDRGLARFSAAKARRILDLSSSDNDDYPPPSQLKATKFKRATGKGISREDTLPVNEDPAGTTPPQPKRAKVIQGAEGRKKEKHRKHSGHAVAPGRENETLHELQKTNELLVQLVGRMKKTEKRVKSIEDRLLSPSGNSSSCGSTPQRHQSRHKSVPSEVRVSIFVLCMIGADVYMLGFVLEYVCLHEPQHFF